MRGADTFFDTSVLLYLISDDTRKADRVEEMLAGGGVLSVQVLNEFASVGLRKRALSLPEVRELLSTLREICVTRLLSLDDHDKALDIAERYGFALYDSVIVASALHAGCRKLVSEDLQHGQVIEKQLRVVNPFRA